MAQDTDRLRHEIDDQRAAISETVDQIENRVVPGRIVARNQDRLQSRLSRWREAVFGADDGNGNANQRSGSAMERARSAASQAAGTVQEAPDLVREQTSGSPLAAGAVALAAGWLVGSLLPRSRTERQLVQRAEPQLADVASTVREEGRETAESLRGEAKDAFEQVKETSREAGRDVAREATSDVRQRTGGS